MQKLLFLALLVPLAAAGPVRAAGPDDAAAIVEELKAKVDDADAGRIRELADLRTREAMEGLLEVYDVMQSIYMRRAILQALPLYDEVEGSQQMALQKLMDVATADPAPELRQTALDGLAASPNYGRPFLRMIVESAADDEVREQALRLHTSGATAADQEWYRSIFEWGSDEPKGKKKSKKKDDDGGNGDGEGLPHRLQELREIAFEALAPDMKLEEILEAASDDKNHQIRVQALAELESRDDRRMLEFAEDIYGDIQERPDRRLFAARVIARADGPKVADDFLKEGGKSATPRELAYGLAELLAEMDDPDVQKKIVKQVGKGKGQKKLFYLKACRGIDDPKLDKALTKLVKDKDPLVQRILPIELVAEHQDRRKRFRRSRSSSGRSEEDDETLSDGRSL